MKKKKIYLLRHGKTAGNLRHSYVGRKTNEGLSEDGILELQEIREQHAGEFQRFYDAMREKTCFFALIFAAFYYTIL